MSRRAELILCTLILLLAAWLRVDRLDDVPPGWRDDEVVETTVHAALVLAGRAPLYFPQAEGHEPLYHYLSAGWIAMLGRSLFSVRLLSALLGVVSVAALYRLARRLFGPSVALMAAAGLTVSFWGLMYSRFKLRHVAEVGVMLLAFDYLLRVAGGAWVGRASGKDGRPRCATALRDRFARRTLAALGRFPLEHEGSTGVNGWGNGSTDKTNPNTRMEAAHVIAPASRVIKSKLAYAVLGGLCLALALYTYFAARAVPFILLGFGVYLAVFHRAVLRAHWRPWAVGLALAGVLFVPLAVAIARMPGGEARLGVVGQPLQALLRGDPGPALANTRDTLGMFAFTGDPEHLYNIPGRPVFEPLGAVLFAVGVGMSVWRWRQPRHAFMLLWLVGGLAPAFVSVPAASLGHTIVAQPAFYVFPALGLGAVAVAARDWRSGPFVTVFVALAFLGVTTTRDLRDYFVRWPALPEVRRLYRADLHAAAPALRRLPEGSPLGLASSNLHPADALALALETPGRNLQPRVFNPARAWLEPLGDWPVLLRVSSPTQGAFGALEQGVAFELGSSRLEALAQPEAHLTAAFENGWTCAGYTLDQAGGLVTLYTYWRIGPEYVAPPPRPVEVLAGTPLPFKFFAHVLDARGAVVVGDDRLDVDPATLRAGDEFIQLFRFALPADLAPGEYRLQVGLYDPLSGVRVSTLPGEDRLLLTRLVWP